MPFRFLHYLHHGRNNTSISSFKRSNNLTNIWLLLDTLQVLCTRVSSPIPSFVQRYLNQSDNKFLISLIRFFIHLTSYSFWDMTPNSKLKLFLSTFFLSVILFPNAYECCSGGGEEKETTEAPVTIGMIFRHIKSSESQDSS